jgi:hypothetical protein
VKSHFLWIGEFLAAAFLPKAALAFRRKASFHGVLPSGKLVPVAVAFVMLGAALAACVPSGGSTFVVNINGDGHDTHPGDGICTAVVGKPACTLRAALEESNALAGANTINFNLPTSPLGSTTISPSTPLPEILDELVIDGTTQPTYDGGKPVVVLEGDLEPAGVRGLVVAENKVATMKALQVLRFYEAGVQNRGGTLTLFRMELAGNKGSGLDIGSPLVWSNATVQETAITENESAGISGIRATLTMDHGAVAYNRSGGIWLNGVQLSMTGTSVSFNSTPYDGGGLMVAGSGIVDVSGVTIEGNSADGTGGGVFFSFVTGTLTVRDSVIKNNRATDGGGLYVERGTARLSGTSLTENKATNNGGGVYLDEFSSSGLGASNALYLEAGTGIGRVGSGNVADSDGDLHGWGGGIYSLGEFHMSSSWIEGNTGDGLLSFGGSIQVEDSTIQDNTICGVNSMTSLVFHTVQITRTSIRRNTGGGVCVINADLTVADSSILDNSGTGISMVGGNLVLDRSTVSGNRNPSYSTMPGGGISGYMLSSMEINESTISGNYSEVSGGGIYLWPCPAGVLNIMNVTISGNRAGKTGGGLEAGQGRVVLNNVTIADNTAGAGGGLMVDTRATVEVTNSILEDNGGGNCSGGPNSLGHNLDSDSSCHFFGSGDLSGVSAALGLLADNGGPTQTHALLAGSPAIDSADDGSCLPTDQRGVSRPQGSHCDMGAFEFSETAAPTSTEVIPTPTPTSAPLVFDPVIFSTQLIYQGGKTCSPREVTIQVRVSDPQSVKSVGLYFRLDAKNGSTKTAWSEPQSMIPKGDGWYEIVLNAQALPSIAGWQGEAWLSVQFIAYGEGGAILAKSGVYQQVSVARCAQ